jgi:hypothetical protein
MAFIKDSAEIKRDAFGKIPSKPEIGMAFPSCCRHIVNNYNSDYACIPCARNKNLLPVESKIVRRA